MSTVVGRLHVESRGRGPAVLCWPSLYCDSRTLDPLVEDLARDHQVVVIDGPGHGASAAGAGRCSIEDCADAAIQVLDALSLARVFWIGAAWGGHVGVLAAARHPARLNGLVVLNAPMQRWRGRQLALMRFTYALLWIFGPRSFVARLIADKMIAANAGPDREAMVDVIASALRRCDRRGLLRAARAAMFQRDDLLPVLPQITVPLVFVAGAEDPLLPVDEARRQLTAVPRCQFVAVARSAHQSALESPAEVRPVVRRAILEWSNGSRTS